jgi:hypothetical protein
MTDDSGYQQSGAAPSSGKSNALAWGLGIGALCLLVCCGGGGIVVWKLGSVAKTFMDNMATSDPAEVRRQTAEMVDIAIPDSYQPVQGMNMVAVRMVMYQTAPSDEGKKGMLMLMEWAIDQPGANAQQQEQQLRNSMNQQRANQNFQSTKSETREIEIRGDKVPFEFSEGTTGQPGQEQATHIVSGVFRGKRDRPVMLQLTIPDEAYDEAVVMEMLESIQ